MIELMIEIREAIPHNMLSTKADIKKLQMMYSFLRTVIDNEEKSYMNKLIKIIEDCSNNSEELYLTLMGIVEKHLEE